MRRPDSLLLGLAIVSGLVQANPITNATHPTVTLSSGVLIGTTTADANTTVPVTKFLGIPFAAPPVGPLRFAPPQPPTPWHGFPRNATAYGNVCFQEQNSDTLLAPESEDCLYLNVITPATPPPANSSGRAVLVWIHGGSLKTGSAAEPKYNGAALAASQDVVFVSTNYRLNAFGFPNSPALPLEAQNLGFWDQRTALGWVKDNIALFGGDPAKVTVWGESSGATSVSRIVTGKNWPGGSPPFRAAIQQSGTYEGSWVDYSPEDVEAEDAWDALVEGLGCSSNGTNTTAAEAELACVRAAPATTIRTLVNNASSWTFTPVSDNVTQLADPNAARLAGDIAHVPLLIGTNANEETVFTTSYTSLAAYLANSPSMHPYEAELTAAYTVGSVQAGGVIASGWLAAANVETDSEQLCPASRVAWQDAHVLGLPVWRYWYNATFPNTEVGGNSSYGAYHSSELAILFGTYEEDTATDNEVALSRTMQTAWANFAKDPWGTGPGWPRVTGKETNATGYPVALLGGPENRTSWVVVGNGTMDYLCGIYTTLYEQTGRPWW